MTDKQLIETFRNIKEQCTGRNCNDCIFGVRLCDGMHCQISMLGQELDGKPVLWDMNAIERIINE